ncbi:hypothetical protein [Rickettsiella endosymbiont of Aleochara curtula]|uniref:hypothetical protein n=1 Tax=Rickettsiella endosymbiont of Aleochara curtula TaxID=3077936 RepID=UPI00313F287B
MKQFEQKKTTAIKSNIAKKIKLLGKKLKTHPAHARRKKDKENWETFFTVSVFIALAGTMIFGIGGWLAVAASGTLLSLIIVESGLFSSLAMGFSAWPVYNTYLWMRDLFSSEKIKSQNKDYDRCHKNLLELKELVAEKNYLITKINAHLKNAIQCLPPNLSSQEETDFLQRDFSSQVSYLEQKKKKLPAYSRRQKDKENWAKIFTYSFMASCAGMGLYAVALIMMMGGPPAILLGPIFPGLLIVEGIFALIILIPVIIGSVLHAAYLGMRDLFSSVEIKAENKQYAQLKKTIAELKKLDKQQSQLDASINSKLLGLEDVSSTHTMSEKEMTDNLRSNDAKNNHFNKYGPMFSEQSANQETTTLDSTPLHSNSI